ncbi:MAG: VWA domain-containing protein [Phycisphaerae bacterium]|nr:VWA domain-containing protein [Phycisphaerae bacterium]
MQWLTIPTALYAAAVSVPLLLLLYFLKLKRVERPISSTLLWKRAVQDLQVNAPFQRLRRNILLLLQFLAILAVLLAIAGPVISMMQTSGSRYVLLIDRSASMNATDMKSTRLQEAKKQAAEFVESLRSKAFMSFNDQGEQVMVMAFDEKARVMCNFTSDKKQIIAAIESITPGDGDSSLSQAVTVARAFAQSPGEDANNRSSETPAKLVLFSDGQIRDADQLTVSADELIFNSIGSSKKNIAIIAMQAKRSYESPQQIDVFATVANYDTEMAVTDIQLSIDGDIQAVKNISLPPQMTDPATNAIEPGKVAVTFTLQHEGAGILEVRQLSEDVLQADDAAWAVLSPPKKLVVLMISNGNSVLQTALKACPIAKLDMMTPTDFEAIDHTARDIGSEYDIIVLDKYAPEKLPRCGYLTFGVIPPGLDIVTNGKSKNQYIVDWRTRHAVLKYVNLTNLFVAEAHNITLPRHGEVLAEFNETPAISLIKSGGSNYLITGFDVLQSNWPFEPGFVLYCYNAVSFLAAQTQQDQAADLKVGDPIILEGLAAETKAVLKDPAMEETRLTANSKGLIRFPEAQKTGLYRVGIDDQPYAFFAVNLLDSKESNIEPRQKLILSNLEIDAQEKAAKGSIMPLWPFLAFIALIFVIAEWVIYNLKVKI